MAFHKALILLTGCFLFVACTSQDKQPLVHTPPPAPTGDAKVDKQNSLAYLQSVVGARFLKIEKEITQKKRVLTQEQDALYKDLRNRRLEVVADLEKLSAITAEEWDKQALILEEKLKSLDSQSAEFWKRLNPT